MQSLLKSFGFSAAIISMLSCSVQKQVGISADKMLIKDSILSKAHIGISIFDPAKSKYLYNHQGDKYFTPASNTKIFTLYAGMKYLGDSIAAARIFENDTALFIKPTGDPSFLHRDFKKHPLADFLRSALKPIYISSENWADDAFGAGWAWNDYNDYYQPERSAFPVYGNVIRWVQEKSGEAPADATEFDQTVSIYSIPEVNWDVRFNPSGMEKRFYVERKKDQNRFLISQGQETNRSLEVPYVTNGIESGVQLLAETLEKPIAVTDRIPDDADSIKTIYSQPADSLFRPLMYRSDNFYAEQILLMISEKMFGIMKDELVTDSILKTELYDLPQRPGWADGSGLSRYNLFTPQIFISILGKMQKEFGMERLKNIFATGGTGTLANFYRNEAGYIYAKTGTLGGVVALSGYLITRKNKTLYFSVLVNNHRSNANEVRKKVETFLVSVRERY